MSDIIYEGKLTLGTFCGPSREGSDRKRWQITFLDPYVVLTRNEMHSLFNAIGDSLREDFFNESR